MESTKILTYDINPTGIDRNLVNRGADITTLLKRIFAKYDRDS